MSNVFRFGWWWLAWRDAKADTLATLLLQRKQAVSVGSKAEPVHLMPNNNYTSGAAPATPNIAPVPVPMQSNTPATAAPEAPASGAHSPAAAAEVTRPANG